MNQSILEKISNQIPPNDCEVLESWKPAEDIKVTLKELIHQLKPEIQLCKKYLEKHLEKKRKVDLISKRLLFLSVSVEDEDSCMTLLRQVLFFFFLLCLKSVLYLDD